MRDALEGLALILLILGALAFVAGFCFEAGSNLAWEMFGYL